MVHKYCQKIRFSKSIILILIGILFTFKPHALNSQNLVTCTFDENPNSTFYTCASNVTATIATLDLPDDYNNLILFYPPHFELISINGQPAIVNPIEESFDFDLITGGSVVVNGQQVQLPISPNATNSYVFAIRTCDPSEGPTLQSFPAYFEAYVANSTADRIDAVFSQPQLSFGANGMVNFNNISTQPFSLSSTQAFPTILNPSEEFERDLIITLQSQNIQGFTIDIFQECDAIQQDLKIKNANGDFIELPFNSSLPNITCSIDENILSQLNLNDPIVIRQYCLADCGSGSCSDALPDLITNFTVSLNCGECDPISRTFQFDSQIGITRPFSITQIVDENELISNDCSSDFINTVKINFEESNLKFGIESIQIPINSEFFNVDYVKVGNSLIENNPDFYNLNTITNILEINLNAIGNNNNSPVTIIPLEFENGDYSTPIGQFELQIELGMSYIITEFQTCQFDNTIRLNKPNQNAKVRLINLCEYSQLVVEMIEPQIEIRNSSYTLTGGPEIADFIEGTNTVVPFEFNFYTSGNVNPLGLYKTNNPQDIDLYRPCESLTYALHLKAIASELSPQNGLSYFDVNNVQATINGNIQVLGVYNGTELVFNLPTNTLGIYNIQFNLALNSACPFLTSLDNSGYMNFAAEIRSVCSTCIDIYRTLTCINYDPLEVNFHCQGGCGGGVDPVSTSAPINIERVTLGWNSKVNFERYHNSNGTFDQPISNNNELLNLIQEQNPTFDQSELQLELENELNKVYPYDLVRIEARGTFTKFSNVNSLYFQVIHSPLPNNQGGSFLNLENATISFYSDNTYTTLVHETEPLTMNNLNPNNVNVPDLIGVPLTTFELHPLALVDINFLTTVAINQNFFIRINAIFRIEPLQLTLDNNAYNASGVTEITVRGLFVAANPNNTQETYNSCDTYAGGLTLLRPGIDIQKEPEAIPTHGVYLLFDEINSYTPTYNFLNTVEGETNLHSYCNSNSAFGIYLFGGLGPTIRDFKYEYRPQISWPTTGSISPATTSSKLIAVNSLYNNQYSGTLDINESQIFFRENVVDIEDLALQPSFMKDPNNSFRYQGLAFTLEKDAHTSLNCNEQTPNFNSQFQIGFNQIDVRKHAYIHPYISGATTQLQIPPIELNPIQSLATQLGTLNVPNNPFTLNSQNLCSILSESISETELNVSESFTFDFDIGAPTNNLETKNIWVSYRIKRDYFPNTGSLLTTEYLYPSFDAATWSTNPDLENGYIVQNPDAINQFVYYFPEGLSQDVPISIPAFPLVCDYETLELEILFGMYCDDNSINTHFSNNPPATCFDCSKTINLKQQSGVNYLSSSTFTFDNCELNWDIQLENPSGNLSITNTEVVLGLPEGLMLSGITEGDINYTEFGSTEQINIAHNLSISGTAVSGAASGDMQTALHFTFPSQPTFEYGSQLNLNLRFQFAQELCSQIEDKITSGLELYLMGKPVCSLSNEQVIIPIDANTQINPIPFTNIPNLQEQLAEGATNGGSCCNSLTVQYSTLNNCPSYANGSISITDVTQTDTDGNLFSIAFDCFINVYDLDGNLLQATNNFPSEPINITGLPEGSYIIEVIHFTLNGDNESVQNYFIEGFVINSSQDNCACDCENTDLAVLDVPPSITNTQELTQYLIDNSLYFPNDDNNEYFSPYISNHCIKLIGDLNVNNEFIFDNCEVKVAMGRRIVVEDNLSDNTELGIYRSVFSGCEFMWKGIENKSAFFSYNSTIADAQYGLLLDRTTGVYSYLRDTDFNHNFVGIKTKETIGAHALNMKNVSFNGGELKLPYNNQLPVQLSTSLAGIVINEEYSLYLDKTIHFDKLCNGVVVCNSTLNALGTTFKNIQPTSEYIGSEYWLSEQSGTLVNGINVGNGNGSGIFCLRSNIKYRGLGFLSYSPIMFDNCLNGIFVNNTHTEIKDTRMTNVRNGILAINLTYDKNLIVNLNRIAFISSGIRIIDSELLKLGEISFNTISGAPNGKTIGISLFGSKRFFLLENKITECRRGISLSTSEADVKSNKVTIPNLSTGIHVAGSIKSTFECNSLIGSSLSNNSQQIGFMLQASPTNHFINNWFDYTHTGFQVSEPSVAHKFLLNNFNNHLVGFDVTPTGILGQFTSAGNRWLAQSYSIAGARNQAMGLDPYASTSTRFIVQPNPTQELWPSQWPLPLQECAGTFFPCLSAIPTPGTLDCPEYTTGGGGGGIGGITTVDDDNFFKLASKVANDSLTFDEFNEELLYAVRKQIERKLSSQELILPDTGSFVTLKYELENGSEEKFNTVDEILKPQAVDSTLHTSIINDLSSIHALTYALFQIDSLTQEPNVNLEQLRFEREQLAAQLEILQAQMRLIEQGALENQGFKRDSAFYYNNGIVTQKEFEQYEKQINTIYLETYAKGNYVFTYGQAETIHQIATMCPSLGGSAVYKARTLNALLNDTLEYNDELTCLQQGVLYRLAQTTIKQEVSEIQVFPNPSTNQLTIKYSNAEAYPLHIEIMDALGRTTSNTMLNSSPAVLSSEITNLATGVYFYRIIDNANTIVKQDKLVKQ
jgi:hypothetical protein